MTERIKVAASHPYDILIGSGLIEDCGKVAANLVSGRTAAVITDNIVADLYAERVKKSLMAAGFETCVFIFPNGEESKNADTLYDALEFLAENHLTKTDLIVALGGGVVGDLAGLAAALYLRGISFIQVPTTLLAAVDSSVGGKTAVNLNAGKNLMGAFWQPKQVICDPDTLHTLQPVVLADGVAEALKYGVLFDKDLFEKIAYGNLLVNLEEIIAQCVDWKKQIVELDEFDMGKRQLLNYGHTLGHAIERCSHYEISHGQAVSIGMVLMARAAWKKNISKENCEPSIRAALVNRGLPVECHFEAQNLYNAALLDKKRRGNSLTLILPETLGHCILYPLPVDRFLDFIQTALEDTNGS